MLSHSIWNIKVHFKEVFSLAVKYQFAPCYVSIAYFLYLFLRNVTMSTHLTRWACMYWVDILVRLLQCVTVYRQFDQRNITWARCIPLAVQRGERKDGSVQHSRVYDRSPFTYSHDALSTMHSFWSTIVISWTLRPHSYATEFLPSDLHTVLPVMFTASLHVPGRGHHRSWKVYFVFVIRFAKVYWVSSVEAQFTVGVGLATLKLYADMEGHPGLATQVTRIDDWLSGIATPPAGAPGCVLVLTLMHWPTNVVKPWST